MFKSARHPTAKELAIALTSAVAMLALAPAAHADTEQAGAEQAVRDAYVEYQARCTPMLPPRFESITWDHFAEPGSDPFGYVGGKGRIHDADPALGGSFVAVLETGGAVTPVAIPVRGWNVVFQFC